MALAHWQRTFTDTAGNVQPNISVTIRNESSGAIAAIFTDSAGTTPKDNPFTTDSFGYGDFYAADGRYRIIATGIDWRNEEVLTFENLAAAVQDAEDAAQAAALNAGIYADTTEGLANTVDGEYFSTPAAGAEEYLTLYRNDSGVATEIDTYPNKTAIDNVRTDLASNLVTEGSDLVAHTGTSDTVTEALDKRTIFVGSVAELEALSLTNGQQTDLSSGGRTGKFRFNSSDLSAEVAADPLQGIYIAPSSDPTGASGASVRQFGQAVTISPRVKAAWFGLAGDGSDDRPAIMAGYDLGFNSVELPEGTFNVTSPLYLDSEHSLFGAGQTKTAIEKATTTVGSGSNTARAGAVTDTYDKNAIIIIRHPDEDYSYRNRIEDLRLESDGYTVDYGIYAPRTSQVNLKNVEIFQCKIGWFTHDSWLATFISCTSNANTRRGLGGANYGWPDGDPSYGFVWEDDGTGGATGTSLNMFNVWARDCHYGYRLFGLQYSNMSACAADNISQRAYWFQLAHVTLSGCACENVYAQNSAWYFEGGDYVLNTCQAQQVEGAASGTEAMIFADGCNLSIKGSDFENFTTANSAYNWIIQSGAKVTQENSAFPTNGNSFISYSGGAYLLRLNSPMTVTDASGTRTATFSPLTTVYKQNKTVVSGGESIADLTASATASVETGIVNLTVWWADTSFPSGGGTANVSAVVYVESGGVNYRQNIVTNSNVRAGNGLTTDPTFTLSRTGNTWSVVMTPGDGDVTVLSIEAKFETNTGVSITLP